MISEQRELSIESSAKRDRRLQVYAGGSESARRQSFANEEDDSERLLHDPVLEIKHAETHKSEQTKKRQQLVSPFHQAM